jgi:Protein of unknown function (DUF3606)
MSDDKTKRGAQDRSRINMNEAYESNRWAKKFGITKEELRSLTKKHGSSVAKIRKALGK